MFALPSLAPALAILVLGLRTQLLIRSFVKCGAVSPQSAMPAATLGIRRGPIFRRLLRRGVIAAVGTELYYLDRQRYREWRATRQTRVLIALALVALIVAFAWTAGWIRP